MSKSYLPDWQRREWLKRGISAATLSLLASSGLLLPRRVLAAYWPSPAFNADAVEDVLLALMGQADVADSREVYFEKGKPADFVTDGRSVSVAVNASLSNPERLAIVVDNHPNPLVMSMDLSPSVRLPLRTRIKVAEGESTVRAIIRADGQLYQTSQTVRVYVGGVE